MAELNAVIKLTLDGQEFTAQLGQVNTQLGDTEKKKESAFDFQGVASKAILAIGGIIAAFKEFAEAFNLTKQFADFEESSEIMEKKFGINADDMISSVNKFLNAKLSSDTIVKESNKALALGIATDTETMTKLWQIAEVQAKLMGTTTVDAFDRITIAIGRRQARGLVGIGIAKDEIDNLVKEETITGKLTDSQTLLNIVMEKGMKNVEDMGKNSKSLADNIKTLESRFTDFKLGLGEVISKAAEPLINILNQFFEWFNKTDQATKAMVVTVGMLVPAFVGVGIAIQALIPIFVELGAVSSAALIGIPVLIGAATYAAVQFATTMRTEAEVIREAYKTMDRGLKDLEDSFKNASDRVVEQQIKANEKEIASNKNKHDMNESLLKSAINKEQKIRIEAEQARLEGQIDKWRAENIMFQGMLDKRHAALTAQHEKELAILKQKEADQKAMFDYIATEQEKAVANENANYQKIKELTIKNHGSMIAVEEAHQRNLYDINKKYDDERVAAEKKKTDEIIKEMNRYVNATKSTFAEMTKAVDKYYDNESKKAKDAYDTQITYLETNTDTAIKLNALKAQDDADNYATMTDRQKQEHDLNIKMNADKAAAERTYKIKAAQIDHDKAIFDKAMAITNATIAGAQAAVVALASAPPPANFILAGLVAAATGVEIGMAATEPIPDIPAFATGSPMIPANTMAMVHAGERIIPANLNTGGVGNEAYANAAIRGLALPTNTIIGGAKSQTNNTSYDNKKITINVSGVNNPVEFVNKLERQYGLTFFRGQNS